MASDLSEAYRPIAETNGLSPPQLPVGARIFFDIWYPVDNADWVGAFTTYFLAELVFTTLELDSSVARKDVDVSSVGGFPLVVFSHVSGSVPVHSVAMVETLAGRPLRFASDPALANPNKAMLYRAMNVNGYEAFYLARYVPYAARAAGGPAADPSRTHLRRVDPPEIRTPGAAPLPAGGKNRIFRFFPQPVKGQVIDKICFSIGSTQPNNPSGGNAGGGPPPGLPRGAARVTGGGRQGHRGAGDCSSPIPQIAV